MTKKEIVTLIDVITKVRQTADQEYDGLVYDNILSIFNNLRTNEKRVLLKGLINICFIVENKVLVSMDDLIDVKHAVESTQNKVNDTFKKQEVNKQAFSTEMSSLKVLLTKAIIAAMITIVLGFMIFLLYADPSEEFIHLLDTVLSFF